MSAKVPPRHREVFADALICVPDRCELTCDGRMFVASKRRIHVLTQCSLASQQMITLSEKVLIPVQRLVFEYFTYTLTKTINMLCQYHLEYLKLNMRDENQIVCGYILLMQFCFLVFYYIPYTNSSNKSLVHWRNASFK